MRYGPTQLSCFLLRLLLSAGNHRFNYTCNVESIKTDTCKIMHFVSDQEYQRTNGPVNAHMRPEIYINKLV